MSNSVSMIIASFNVNSVRTRMPVLERWIRENSPDVLCLQETKVRDEEFPIGDISALGYHAYFRGEKSYNGVAILSRTDLGGASSGFDGKGEDEGPRLISVNFKDCVIVNTYIPQGTSPDSERFQYKLEWFRRLKKYFADLVREEKSVIWLGDFNVAPDPIDVYDPKRLLGSVAYHPDEHKVLALVKELGFVDIFRKHVPEPNQYSFWDFRIKGALDKGLGWRVDHIWALGSVAARSKRAWIDIQPRTWERPSDHTLICAEFDI